MGIDILEIAGYDPNDPEIIAAGEDFDEFADLITALHRARKAQGITQKQIARTMQTTQSAASDIERIGGNPTIRTLFSYTRAMGMRLRLVAEPTPRTIEPTSDPALNADAVDGLLAAAERLTGISDRVALVDAALTCLIERESAKRLSRLGGSAPAVVGVSRRRQSRTG